MYVCLAAHRARLGAGDLLANDHRSFDGEEGHVDVDAGLVQLVDLVVMGAAEGSLDGWWFVIGVFGSCLASAFEVVAGSRASH